VGLTDHCRRATARRVRGHRVALLVVLAGGCSSEPAVPPADAAAASVSASAARLTPVAMDASSATAPPASAAAPTAPAIEPCETAFSDQVMLYVPADLTVHPARKERFLLHCRNLPMALQHCASPLYRQDHSTECDAAQEQASPDIGKRWSAMFAVLQAEGSVTKPPP